MATPRGPILTQTDRELLNAPRGAELADGVRQRMIDRAPMAMPPTTTPAPAPAPAAMTWGDFQQRHPEWEGDHWAECRALYSGGKRLLGDDKLLERLFPKHRHEAADVYAERKKRAHYFPYPGTIIDHLLAGLGTDPLDVSFAKEDEKGKQKPLPGSEWWQRWVTDVTDSAERPSDYGLDDADEEDDDEGGTPLHHFCVDTLREAMQTGTAWVLADLPPVDPDAPAPVITSRADEEKNKADPFLQLVPAEQVIDWRADARGSLLWAIVMTCEQIRATPSSRRGKVLHTYVVWDRTHWTRYEIEVDPAQLPPADQPVPMVAQGAHGFGRVPIERLQLPEGLYAMGKLHSLAREHLNKRCAMSWAEYKSLFAVLYEFLGAEDNGAGLPTPGAQMDGNRAVNQTRGQGYTQIRGKDDDARFVGPEVAPFVEARNSCNDTMREMHRVMYSMALSANMDGAALKRSGDSKEMDAATTAVLLDALGVIVRRFARRLLLLASLGRGEAAPSSRLAGLEQFDVQGTTEAIQEAVELFNGVPIMSALFRELYLSRLYGRVLGDVTQQQRETIRDQVRESVSEEESLLAQGMLPGNAGNVVPPEPATPPGEEGGGDKEQGTPIGKIKSRPRAAKKR